jgi:hypothetical protein
MKLTNDRVRNTRFVYQACRHGHGRFTTFYNFLSEKQFVRELTPAERNKLCATVKQIKCSGCGAPVDLTKSDACEYCRAPVSVFDRDAAKKAIDHYLRERHKQVPLQMPPQHYGYSQQHRNRSWDAWDTIYAADLASDLLWALGRAATRGLSRGVPPAAVGVSAGSVIADASIGAPLSNVPGGLMDTLGSAGAGVGAGGEASLATATDLLFGGSGANAAAGVAEISSAASVLADGGALGSALPSATDALFGGSGASDLFASASTGAADFASSALDGVSDAGADVVASVGENLGDVASSAGDGIVDLVSDGLGSLITSIFD